MSCITQLLKMKGSNEILPICDEVVIEGGGVYKDHEYIIVFVRHGHRCGYVALQDSETERFESELAKETYKYPELSAHGGITFYDRHHKAKDLLPIHCNDMWVGFDAAHWGDSACHDTAKKYFSVNARANAHLELMKSIHQEVADLEAVDPEFSHKTYAYMEQECHNIIDELIASAA